MQDILSIFRTQSCSRHISQAEDGHCHSSTRDSLLTGVHCEDQGPEEAGHRCDLEARLLSAFTLC